MATLIDIAQRRTEREAGHPSIETLQTFAAERLEADALLSVTSHLLDGCPRCRRILRDSFGVEQSSVAAYRIQAPPDLVDRIRTLAEISPAQLRLALTNLAEPSATIKAAAALEAHTQLDDPHAIARLLCAGAEYLLDVTENGSALEDEDALVLGRLVFRLGPHALDTGHAEETTSIIERAWSLIHGSGAFPLPEALVLSAFGQLERSTSTDVRLPWTRPPAKDALGALVEAQRLFALAPSAVEHALSTFALTSLALEARQEKSPDLLEGLSRTLEQQELRLRDCGERRMARVAAEYRFAIEVHARQWHQGLELAERLIRGYDDEGDTAAALRLQVEAARIHRELGDLRAAKARMQLAKNGLLINGYALESAFAALELAEIELESGSTSCSSLAADLLPIFAAIDDREAVAVLLMVRDAALASTLGVDQLRECRALLFELTSS